MRSVRRASWPALVIGLTLCLSSCGSDDGGSSAPVAVLSAFPAELAAVLEHVTVERTVVIADRSFRIGTVDRTSVVVGMTGIGLINAANVTRALLEQMEVAGVIVSGVAGSSLRIGDVAVPSSWSLVDGSTFAPDPSWLAAAEQLATVGTVSFEHCTVRPSAPEDDPICLAHQPQIVVGGTGESADSFVGAVSCQPNGGDIFGCDATAPEVGGEASSVSAGRAADADVAAATDMETAAIAREAAAAGVRFIAFRAVSDGAGDPLGLPGFPAQFFTYYRLAAHNAAAAAAAFLERVAKK